MATIMDTNENEILQKDFKTINAVCDFLNNKYSDLWDFVDARVAKKEGGCDSCAAH
jgi:DNA-binding Xre family transcriptional regulator